MDGDRVSEEPSDPITLTEVYKKAFPQYLAMGMTYDEYWNGCPSLVRDYREAHLIKLREEEWARWRQAAYIYDLLLRVSPALRPFNTKIEPKNFLEEPFPLTQREADEREAKRERENTERFIALLEKESERNLKKRAEEAAKEANKDA